MKSENRPKSTKAAGARRTAAVLALLTSPTVEAAADLAGVARSTLFAWLREPAFAAELEAARDKAFRGGLAAIKGAATKAAGKLVGLLDSRNEALRLRAALAVLELGLRIREADEILARIAALEAAFSAGNPSGRLEIAAPRG